MNIELRNISIDDSEDIVKWRNNHSVKANLYSQEDLTLEGQINYFHKYIESGLVHQFIIVVDGVSCGTSFLKNIDFVSKQAEFGIFIGDNNYRGKGIGKVATKKTIEYGFCFLRLQSIYLTVLKDNNIAISSYKSVGFKEKRIMKNNYLRDDVFFDVVEMEINSHDFKNHKEGELIWKV